MLQPPRCVRRKRSHAGQCLCTHTGLILGEFEEPLDHGTGSERQYDRPGQPFYDSSRELSCTADLLPCQPAEQKPTKYDEQNIRKPDEQFRVRMRVSTQRIADDDKEKISCGDDQAHGEPD